MLDYARSRARKGASIKVLALIGALAGAAYGQAQGPLSPWMNIVDLSGRYMAPSPANAGGDGIARVNTSAGDNVLELSNGVLAQENTFTPFSDAFKKPLPLTLDIRGHSVSADIDLGSPLDWANSGGDEAFAVGIGTAFGSAGPLGVVVEARYFWVTPLDPHAQFRLRTQFMTGPWMDGGSYADKQVNGTFTARIDISPSGTLATMVVTPKPTLLPPPPWLYNDITDSQPASISGPTPFMAGFWTSGTPGTVRGTARLVRMVTDVGDMTMYLKSTFAYITSSYGQSIGATAPLTTEFHLDMAGLPGVSRGYQASGIYYGTVPGYFITQMNMDPTSIQDQSYTDPFAGPFPYPKSPYVFNVPLWNTIVGGVYGFANFRIAGASAPGTPGLNTDAELAGLPVGPVWTDFWTGQSGGALWVQLTPTDPEGILGVTGCAYDNGEILPAIVRGSDIVLVDEVPPIVNLSGGGVTENGTDLVPPLPYPQATAYEGLVTVKFTAMDLGNLNDATGSGLNAIPQGIIERLVDGHWVPFYQTTVYPLQANLFTSSWTIGLDTPVGIYRVHLQAVDRVGLVTDYYTRQFAVQTLKSITLNLSLQGLVGNPNANNQRLIRIMVGSAPGTPPIPGGSITPRTIIDRLVRFTAGQATVVLTPPDLPTADAHNLIAWAKDAQHTTGTASPPQNGIVGSAYTFNLLLKSGDVNNDNVVNFTDYAMFIADYGKVAPRDMTSMSWYRNCDFNGSGQVDFADWILFYPNYGTVGSAMPDSYVRAYAAQRGGQIGDVNASDPKLTRMTVKQLVKLGVADAAKWDTNHDGWVDKAELDKALQGKTRGSQPRPVN